MNVQDAIAKRREITAYTEKAIPEDVMERLIRALYLAPAGNNLPSREFIVVQDRDMLVRLSATTPYTKWLAGAAAGVVITGKPDLSKYWLQDASIAGAFLWLAAVSEGLGVAWGAVYHSEDAEESRKREAYVRETAGVPEDQRVVALIGLGYPAAEPAPKEMYPLETVLHREKFGG